MKIMALVVMAIVAVVSCFVFILGTFGGSPEFMGAGLIGLFLSVYIGALVVENV